jgi:hypothetical protein
MLYVFLQDSFLWYFSLKPVNSDDVPRATSPLKKSRCKGRYPMGVRLSRCCSIPFSSPLGITIQKRYRTTAVNSQVSYMLQVYGLTCYFLLVSEPVVCIHGDVFVLSIVVPSVC